MSKPPETFDTFYLVAKKEAEKVKADTKGNKPMGEELFTEETIKRLTIPEGASPRNSEYYESMVVDIETYTNHALDLRTIVANAESNLEKARKAWKAAKYHVKTAEKDLSEAEVALDYATTNLQNHLNAVRGTHVTLRGGRHE